MTKPATTQEAAQGTMAAMTGLGVVTMALFPLSLPFLILTAAALAPLLLIGAVAMVPVALVAAFAFGARAIARRLRRPVPAGGEGGPTTRTGVRGVADGAQPQ